MDYKPINASCLKIEGPNVQYFGYQQTAFNKVVQVPGCLWCQFGVVILVKLIKTDVLLSVEAAVTLALNEQALSKGLVGSCFSENGFDFNSVFIVSPK